MVAVVHFIVAALVCGTLSLIAVTLFPRLFTLAFVLSARGGRIDVMALLPSFKAYNPATTGQSSHGYPVSAPRVKPQTATTGQSPHKDPIPEKGAPFLAGTLTCWRETLKSLWGFSYTAAPLHAMIFRGAGLLLRTFTH